MHPDFDYLPGCMPALFFRRFALSHPPLPLLFLPNSTYTGMLCDKVVVMGFSVIIDRNKCAYYANIFANMLYVLY